jgi:hypothetical protein
MASQHVIVSADIEQDYWHAGSPRTKERRRGCRSRRTFRFASAEVDDAAGDADFVPIDGMYAGIERHQRA